MVTSLDTGDFAFVGYNFDAPDDFAIVLLVDITAPLTVYFTDDEWNGSAFNPGEDTMTWTTPASLAAGTVISFNNLSVSPTVSSGHGSVSGTLSLSSGGDSILAYQGSFGTPSRFISGFATDELGFAHSSGTLSGTGLVVGQTAIETGLAVNNSVDGGVFSGARDSGATFEDYSAAVNTIANWTLHTTDGTLALPFNTTAFTTGGADTTAPLLSTLSPTDGALNVGLNSNLVLGFNEDVQVGTGTITIRRTDDNSVFETITVPSGAVSASGMQVTINPTGTFETATRYHIEVSSTAITDTSGNAYVGISNAQDFNFSTVLPSISAAPALSAGSIAFTGFNTDGNADDFAIVVLEELDGSVNPFQIYFTDQTWNGSALATGSDGTLIWTVDELIPAGTVVNFNDIGSEATLNTSNFGVTHGFVSRDESFSPASAGDVVLAYTGTLESPGTFLAGFATDTLGFTQSGGTLSGTGLVEGVTAANFGALEDGLDGASYTGDRTTEATFAEYLDNLNSVSIGNYTTVNGVGDGETLSPFTSTTFSVAGPDVTPPGLLSVTPSDGTASVTVGSNLTITFNEDVQVGTGNITIYSGVDDSIVAQIDVTSGQVSVSGATVTINPTNDLAVAQPYYVQIDSGAIEDTAGNDFGGISNTTDWNFSTELPALSTPSLSAGAIAFTGLNVDGNEDLSFVVLEDLNGASNPFQVFFTDNEWTGTSFNVDAGTITWTVTSDIAAGTVVTFSNVRDGDVAGYGASVGLIQETNSFDINSAGDVIFAYVGTQNAPTSTQFLAGIATDELGFGYNPGGLTNTGLVAGSTAISLSDGSTSPDGAAYTGTRDNLTSIANYASQVNTAGNWTLDQTNGENLLPFSTTSFEVANSAPTQSGAPSDVTVTEDTASNVDLSAMTLADVDGDTLTVTLVA
ncbi:Ig-like domain-containing protein, partial [uncultured Pelagimonas sp.]|uniref:Ig-like domain-containing protein n=1 Tax=uncultured Pelagimonas sp. TaxID=1618102 RepID=UPI0026184F19